MIWGVDLGVRSFHAVGLPSNPEDFRMHVTHTAPKTSRGEELRDLTLHFGEHVLERDIVFVEEPPLAGRLNIRTFGQLSMTAGAILSATSARGYVVPVSSWKKSVCGNGSFDKANVAQWLRVQHPELHELAGGDQNFVDAACIALYGVQASRVGGELGASPGDLDSSL